MKFIQFSNKENDLSRVYNVSHIKSFIYFKHTEPCRQGRGCGGSLEDNSYHLTIVIHSEYDQGNESYTLTKKGLDKLLQSLGLPLII